MNIYIAGKFSRREELAEFAEDVRDLGHHVTSRWLGPGAHEWEGEDTDGTLAFNEAVRYAREDYEDVLEADLVICFTETPRSQASISRGGRHVEFGVALAKGKDIWLVGPRENVFHFLPSVGLVCESKDVALQFLMNGDY